MKKHETTIRGIEKVHVRYSIFFWLQFGEHKIYIEAHLSAKCFGNI